MYIWYISSFEPLPVGEGGRLLRSGMIARALADGGHKVELWIPSFDHQKLRVVAVDENDKSNKFGFRVRYLPSLGYTNDVSLRRYISNFMLGFSLRRLLRSQSVLPDLIVCQIPLIELSLESARFAKSNDIPYVVDIRDPWPDIYKRLLPKYAAWMFPIFFVREIWAVKYILRNAASITAVSRTYVDWSNKYLRGLTSARKRCFYIGYQPADRTEQTCPPLVEFAKIRARHRYLALYCGSLGNNCDVGVLIEASKLLSKSDCGEIGIVVVGGGEGELELATAADSSDCLYFLGWTESCFLPQMLNESDVGLAVFPASAMNSMTNKYFEYLYYGLPIVNSLSGEAASLLNEINAGLTYESGNPVDFIEKLYGVIKKIRNSEYKASQISEVGKMYDASLIYKNYVEFLTSTNKGVI